MTKVFILLKNCYFMLMFVEHNHTLALPQYVPPSLEIRYIITINKLRMSASKCCAVKDLTLTLYISKYDILRISHFLTKDVYV